MKTILLFFLLCSRTLAANYYLVTQPLTVYTDASGKPLQSGYIYFGAINQNPITNPITMTWDAAGTIPATQPLRTINGYISRQGTPANIYAPSAYSVSVQNSLGALVFNNPNSLVLSPQAASAISLVDAGNYYSGNANVEAAFQVLGPLIAQVAAAFTNNQFTPTGVMQPYCGTVAPTGYVLADGNTIGDASSGATRPNADTQSLFTLLWNTTNTSVTAYPSIQNLSGSPTSRGASASIDFNTNHCRFPVPDLQGRVIAGVGGSRITIAGGNFDGTTYLNSGGLQNHTLITAELASHTHGITDPGHTHTFTGTPHTHTYNAANNNLNGGAGAPVASLLSSTTSSTTAGGTNSTTVTGVTVNAAGSGTAHTILQPTMVSAIIIKL